MKEKTYAVDSTKGSSMINPLNYKGDVLVQLWMDSRVLATIVRWMDSKGNYPRYMSQGVRRPLEVLTGFLVDNGEVDMVEDTKEARALLTRRFNVDLNRGGRGEKNVIHNLSLSGKRNDIGERMSSNRVDINKPVRKQSNPKIAALLEKACRKHKELFSDESKEIKHYDYSEEINHYDYSQPKEEEVKRVYEEDIPLLKEKGNSRELVEARIRKADEDSQKELDKLNSFDPMSLMALAKKEKKIV